MVTVKDRLITFKDNLIVAKNNLATAITGKGVTASGTDSFADLSTKIESIPFSSSSIKLVNLYYTLPITGTAGNYYSFATVTVDQDMSDLIGDSWALLSAYLTIQWYGTNVSPATYSMQYKLVDKDVSATPDQTIPSLSIADLKNTGAGVHNMVYETNTNSTATLTFENPPKLTQIKAKPTNPNNNTYWYILNPSYPVRLKLLIATE
jgi:hypothetical protein